MPEQDERLDAAMVGKMFVTNVSFDYHTAGSTWKNGKDCKFPAGWTIQATLHDDPSDRYSSKRQTMTIEVEQGVGQKLAEVLLPVIVADASRKAQQLADESRTMLAALGERAILCITNMPPTEKAK